MGDILIEEACAGSCGCGAGCAGFDTGGGYAAMILSACMMLNFSHR
jgi:hypothetical protein